MAHRVKIRAGDILAAVVAHGSKCSLRCVYLDGNNENYKCEAFSADLLTDRDGYPFRDVACFSAEKQYQ